MASWTYVVQAKHLSSHQDPHSMRLSTPDRRDITSVRAPLATALSNCENASDLVSFGFHRSNCGSRSRQCGQPIPEPALESD